MGSGGCVMKIDMDVIGRPGGIARAAKLSAARRKEIAVKAAETRWKNPAPVKRKKKKAKK